MGRRIVTLATLLAALALLAGCTTEVVTPSADSTALNTVTASGNGKALAATALQEVRTRFDMSVASEQIEAYLLGSLRRSRGQV